MTFRKKIYYPDSQITKNLFTSGKEWMILNTWQEYVGYYHRYSNGEVYTEREWDENRSLRLTKYKDNPEAYFRYLDLKNYSTYRGEKYEIVGAQKFYTYVSPRAVKVIPNEDEISDGSMKRYFLFKRNEPNAMLFEIDETQVKSFTKDNAGINQYLYDYFTIIWKLTGPELDVFENGIVKMPGVVSSNQRIIDRYSKKFPILRQILNNPREHTIYDK